MTTGISSGRDEAAKRVWRLMTEDFYWSRASLSKLRVGVRSPTSKSLGEQVKLQPFEVVVAVVFSRLRPDYEWWVTPNRPDGGVDFIGRGVFLVSKELGIDAAITIGGQCKKRNQVRDVIGELTGSFSRMAVTLHPTFFVAAFSAVISTKRISDAKAVVERVLQRHCHILDRHQLESLIAANVTAVEPIIRQAFTRQSATFVLNYFRRQHTQHSDVVVNVIAPASVLAGEPFRVQIRLSRSSITATTFRCKWTPADREISAAALVGPLQLTSPTGIMLDFGNASTDDPFLVELELEFLVYAVGPQNLGSVTVYSESGGTSTTELACVNVIENLRPPFYDAPYRGPLDELARGLAKADAGRVSCVAVVGAGGAGKTRLCEEMCLESRRQGALVVSAGQVHSTEFPRRILANLLLGLTEPVSPNQTPADRISDILRRLEPQLARRARPAIQALLGGTGKGASFADDQSLLSVLALLIARQTRAATLIVHLHDLHWCTLDVLEVIDKLIWQLGHLKVQAGHTLPTGVRVLFLLEGRTHEHRKVSETGWSTHMFERFIERLGCPVATCRSFEPHESATFVRRLFEQAHSANRKLPNALLGLQDELINAIHAIGGVNPQHMLEQVKLLQQHGVVAQNPRTGFMYMIKPDFRRVPLPPSVLETIEARWRYYSMYNRPLGTLLWAIALVDDEVPMPLFRYLWRCIAPEVPRFDIEGTEFLRVPESDMSHVSFRHENYFQVLRQVQLPDSEVRPIIRAYSEWFRKERHLSPPLRLLQAKIELERPRPNLVRVQRILRATQASALRRNDRILFARVLETLLDEITWPAERRRHLSSRLLTHACDDEIELCRQLIRSGFTDKALERIEHALVVIDSRFGLYKVASGRSLAGGLVQRKFRLLTIRAGILYHDRRSAEAVAITNDVLASLENIGDAKSSAERREWRELLMEVRHVHSVALALNGDVGRAVLEARKAADLAETLLTNSQDALDVIITYANILLSESPKDSERILMRYERFAMRTSVRDDTRLRLKLNLSMSRIVLGYRELRDSEAEAGKLRLQLANEALLDVFKQAHPLGRLANAAAAALLIGLIRVLWGRQDDVDWFSQAVALAVRARQLETLWRAYINLAHSLHKSGHLALDTAAAALEIMVDSLSSYAEPDRTPRFDLIAVPMAHAVRYLLLASDERATAVLRRFPALSGIFADLNSAELKDNRGGRGSHEWLRVGSQDYVLY